MGVLHGSIDEMMAVELGGYFLPCGLGHLIGLDTHDVGGYLSGTWFFLSNSLVYQSLLPCPKGCPERRQEKGFKSLRTARVLEKVRGWGESFHGKIFPSPSEHDLDSRTWCILYGITN